jgi:CheY-like chemotaxis protein
MIRILIVEDNRSDVVLLRHALAEHGVRYEPTLIADGEEAIQFVTGPPEGGLPSLVILDLNLPKRDGLEVLSAIRASDRLREVPVVILTTSDSPVEQERAERTGVRAYLRKPPDLESFLALGAVLRGICEEVSPEAV